MASPSVQLPPPPPQAAATLPLFHRDPLRTAPGANIVHCSSNGPRHDHHRPICAPPSALVAGHSAPSPAGSGGGSKNHHRCGNDGRPDDVTHSSGGGAVVPVHSARACQLVLLGPRCIIPGPGPFKCGPVWSRATLTWAISPSWAVCGLRRCCARTMACSWSAPMGWPTSGAPGSV